jgi:NADPH:quinone reductase-like Zn-dependent oxidoreductase
MEYADAAAIPEVFETAFDALILQAKMQAGERVLISAVGSGVGLAAVQLVRAFGGVPYGVSRTPEKIEAARKWGLEDGCTALDQLASKAQAWSGGAGMNVVLDLTGGPFLEAAIQAAAMKARLMLIGTVAGAKVTLPLGMILGKRLTLRGTVLRARPTAEKIELARSFEKEVDPLFLSGVVKPVVDRKFPVAQIVEAHRYLESNESFGKVVLMS